MDTTNVAKGCKRKRKKELIGTPVEEGGSFIKSDRDLKHKHKRIRTSDLVDAEVSFGTEQQEELLHTVSGHIRELVAKERRLTDPSNRTKRKSKSSIEKAGTKSSNCQEENKGAGECSNGVSVSRTEDDVECIFTATPERPGVSQESALEYLRLWKEERERWSFKKKTQYWLLQNMYDRTKVSSEVL